MKLEVGTYVRTDLGEIGKITSVSSNLNDLGINGIAYNSEPFLRGNEIKASHNIIDLIEVGDYVNGYIVLDIMKNNLGITYIECGCKDEIAHNYVYDTFYEEDIKSIVTREQFSTMEYKLGDK